jgi:tetratricopeptide (TPR) repeat protein
MQKQPKNEARKVVPRWREFSRTPHAELISALNVHRAFLSTSRDDFKDAVEIWRQSPSLRSAEQILAIASLGVETEVTDQALNFISKSDDVRHFLKQSSFAILNKSSSGGDEIVDFGDPDLIRSTITIMKERVNSSPRNAIASVDLARLYSISGFPQKARSMLIRALAIAPLNRFVVRSAARFLIHDQDPKQALDVLLRASASNDPWIMASAVATADLLDERSKIPLKRARSLLLEDHTPVALSELNATFGTLEIGEGNIKKAKKLLRKSIDGLTENVAAQIEWISEFYHLNMDIDFSEVDLSYEADAMKSYHEKKWIECIGHITKWFNDERFSARPAIRGSYVASEFLGDFSQSLKFAVDGLAANPNNSTLLNNAAYTSSELGDLDQATNFLERARRHRAHNESQVSITATEGHIKFRLGQTTIAAELYEKAIRMAIGEKDRSSAERVLIHWLREEARVSHSLSNFEFFRGYFSKDGKASKENREIFSRIVETPKSGTEAKSEKQLNVGILSELEQIPEGHLT